jgi:hypothetical protein
MTTRIGFYIEIEVRSLLILLALDRASQSMKCRIVGQLIDYFMPINWSKLYHKSIPLVIVILLTIIALKIRDVLTYSLVLLILYVVCRPTSRFATYKTLFALVAILIAVEGVVVRGAVSLVGIK